MSLPSSVGQIVLYHLTDGDVAAINSARFPTVGFAQRILGIMAAPSGKVGSPVATGAVYPMVVTAIRPLDQSVNGQVILDGNDNLWVNNIREGFGNGNWSARA